MQSTNFCRLIKEQSLQTWLFPPSLCIRDAFHFFRHALLQSQTLKRAETKCASTQGAGASHTPLCFIFHLRGAQEEACVHKDSSLLFRKFGAGGGERENVFSRLSVCERKREMFSDSILNALEAPTRVTPSTGLSAGVFIVLAREGFFCSRRVRGKRNRLARKCF
jgi:hypothetical protein